MESVCYLLQASQGSETCIYLMFLFFMSFTYVDALNPGFLPSVDLKWLYIIVLPSSILFSQTALYEVG